MKIKSIFGPALKLFLILSFINLSLSDVVNAAGIADLQQSLKTETISASGKIQGTVTGCEGSALNIRNGAWGSIIGSLNNGASVTITGTDGDWYKIE